MDTIVNEIARLKKKNEGKQIKAVNGLEKLLKWLFLASFVLLVLAQALLTDPSIRNLVNKEAVDGIALENVVYLVEQYKVEIRLKDTAYCPELRVLINGDEVGNFSSDTMLLNLKDGDVVELDASRLLLSINVQISGVSGNIEELLGKSFTVSGGIVKIAGV